MQQPMQQMTRLIAVGMLAAHFINGVANAETLPRLRVENGRILDADGKAVTLRGVNLGNWLLIERACFTFCATVLARPNDVG
jgi:hypothetical protein